MEVALAPAAVVLVVNVAVELLLTPLVRDDVGRVDEEELTLVVGVLGALDWVLGEELRSILRGAP